MVASLQPDFQYWHDFGGLDQILAFRDEHVMPCILHLRHHRITPPAANPCTSQGHRCRNYIEIHAYGKITQSCTPFIYHGKVKTPLTKRAMVFILAPDSLLVSHINLITDSFYRAAIETEPFYS